MNLNVLKIVGLLTIMVNLISCSGCIAISGSSHMRTDTQSIDLEGASSVQAELKMRGGKLIVAGGADELLAAIFSYDYPHWRPQVKYSVTNNGQGKLTVQHSSSTRSIPIWSNNEWALSFNNEVPIDLHFKMRGGEGERSISLGSNSGSNNEWALSFNNEVPIDLRLEMGAGEGDISLKNLSSLTRLDIALIAGELDVDLTGEYPDLTRLNINQNVGELDVDLSGTWHNDLDVHISNGIGEVSLRVPDDVGVRVVGKQSLGEFDVGELKKEGKAYVNEAFGKSDVTLRIKVEQTLGELNITN